MRNINNTLSIVRRYPLSTAVIVVVWTLSLMPIPETPLSDVTMIDKWTHIVMYGGLSLTILIEYLHEHADARWRKLTVYTWLVPVLMGGLLELIQAYCTGGRRSGEWLDFFADAVGSTLILCVGTLWVWCRARANRASDGAKRYRNDGRQ